VSIGPIQSSIAILPKNAVDVVEKCKEFFVGAGLGIYPGPDRWIGEDADTQFS